MAYEVIARKWRPQSFADLVGQEHVSRTLTNALRNNRLPQGLLFTGVRGTGKTSSARILAKSLRCPNAVDFVPCGVCRECEDIAHSRSLDVIEIDGASNNGVDAIRELRDTVGYMPSSGKYKIYIIDEVHMLSTSAFNALLKTLEEPPSHVIFILATTEVQKLPSTILSRLQRFDFRRIPSRQIASHLEKICKAENVKAAPEALWLLARHGDGSLRDSQSLLDQVITFCEGELTLDKVIDVLGLTDRTLLLQTLEGLLNRDSQAIVNAIEKIFQSGYDAKLFAQDLLEEIRNALLVRLCAGNPSRVVDLPESEIAHLSQITESLSEEDLQLLFDMTLKGVNDLIRSQDARLVLEMLLLRMAAAPRIASLAMLLGAPLPMAGTHAPAPAAAPQTKAPAPAAAPAKPEAKKYDINSFVKAAPGAPPYVPKEPSAPKPQAAPVAKAAPTPPPMTTANQAIQEAAESKDPWTKFVNQIKKENGLLGAMLENTHLVANDADKVTIGIARKMSFLFDKVKEPENVKRIEAFVETFWQKKATVEIKLADEKVTPKATPKTMAEQADTDRTKSIEHAVESNPLVQSAQNIFKAQIKSIKDTGASKGPGGKGSN